MNPQDEEHYPGKTEVNAAFKCIEAGLACPDFDHAWNDAQKLAAAGARPSPARVSTGIFTGPRAGYAAATCLLLIAAAGLYYATLSDVESRQRPYVVDNYDRLSEQEPAWYSETDLLLDIPVLSYENRYLTFASYNPSTMEIIE